MEKGARSTEMSEDTETETTADGAGRTGSRESSGTVTISRGELAALIVDLSFPEGYSPNDGIAGQP